MEVRAKRPEEAEFIADRAACLYVDPRLAALVHPEKRLGLVARVLDRFPPRSFRLKLDL